MQTMTVFFDGACPLCAAEIHLLAARNRRRLLRFVDLSQPGVELPCTVVCARAMDNIHAILDDGRTLIGVPVFAEAYRRADLPLPAWLFSRPWLGWLLVPAYALFARHRAKISALLGPPLLRLAQWAYRQEDKSIQYR
jgi:predicted DCC family thiol-disulfide oxidoreductase YuxK